MNEIVDIYVDGSFIGDQTKWAMIGVENGKELFRERGILMGPVCEMRQIGGELKGSMQAIVHCRKRGKRARIFYDYKGIACWVGHIFGGEKWRANNQWTQAYRDFVEKNRQHIAEFVWVKGHSGNKWNEEVDEYVKGA